MSTYMYLYCLDHNPPIVSREEVGQHWYDLPRIYRHLELKDAILRDLECESEDDCPLDWEDESVRLNSRGWNDLCPEKDTPYSGVAHRQIPVGMKDAHRAYFVRNMAKFLREHPHCTIAVYDEYGNPAPLNEATPIPRWIADLYQGDWEPPLSKD